MANSYTEIAGDGVTTIFSIPFGYIDVAHIDVLVDGLPVSFEWIGSATVSVSPAPEVGSVVRISRVTPKDPIVDFRDGESLTESDLDSVGLQALYLSQESEDNLGTVLQVKADGVVDGMNRRIRNVANPVDAQDVATKLWAETGMSSQLSAATLQAVIATNKAQEAADSAASAAANAAITVAAGYNPANVTITGGVIGGISNLGLGTPAPSVAGWSTIRMEGTQGGNIAFTVGGTLFAEMYSQSGGDLIIGTASAGDDLIFRTKGVTRGTFTDAGTFFLEGNMAIGDPSASSSTSFGSLRLGRSTGGSVQFYQGTTVRGELYSNGVNISLSADDPTGEVRLRAGGNTVFSVSAAGVNGAVLNGGFTANSDNDGSFATGTYTPTPTGGNFKSISNAGAFTFAAPTEAGVYTLVVEITNATGAGAVTFSGFAKVSGSLTTTVGNRFQVLITKTLNGVTANVVGMQ